MEEQTCESCGKQVAGFESVSLGREGKYKTLCYACFNRWAAERMGLDFEHPNFEAVTLQDSRGVSHEFRFRASLAATGLLIEALEVREDQAEGYEFAVLGEHEEDPLELFGRLYARMRQRLGQQHLEEGDDGLRIGEEQVVRGMITWGEETDRGGRAPGLVIDGRCVTWEELGRMVASFEGFQFKLAICDRTDEMEDCANHGGHHRPYS